MKFLPNNIENSWLSYNNITSKTQLILVTSKTQINVCESNEKVKIPAEFNKKRIKNIKNPLTIEQETWTRLT